MKIIAALAGLLVALAGCSDSSPAPQDNSNTNASETDGGEMTAAPFDLPLLQEPVTQVWYLDGRHNLVNETPDAATMAMPGGFSALALGGVGFMTWQGPEVESHTLLLPVDGTATLYVEASAPGAMDGALHT